jgi:GT2 family glycosyltransferase
METVMNKPPLVSIIIVNWNGGKIFDDCLKSLNKIDYPNWELIIVDNGSRDGSEKYAQIKNKTNKGFAPANNQAIKKTNGKYILLLNNDTLLERNFLTKLVERMESDHTIGVIQPKIIMMDKRGYLDNAGSFFTKIGFLEHWGFGQKDGREFSKEAEIFSAKGACMLIQKNIINEIGLFDNDFFSYFEESDFCWRVWLSGWRVIFYPEAKIYHKVGFTVKRLDVSNINYHYYKNRICSLIKNLDTSNLLLIMPVHLTISIAIGLIFLFKGKFGNFALILRAIFWNMANLPNTLKKRKRVQSKRKIGDKEMFTKLSRPVNMSKFYKDFKRVEKDIDQKKTK